MSGGTRPNALSSFLFDRGLRFAAGLAIVVTIPVAVLFYFQFRSHNDLETTAAVVLRPLSSDTVESLARGIEDALKRPHIGVLLGVGAAYLISNGAGWPLLIEPASIVIAVVFSGLVGVFFGWYPAIRASKLDPIEALRHT